MQGRAKPIIAGFGCMPPSLDDLRLPSVEITEGGPKRNLGTEALSRGTGSSNPSPSSGESRANPSRAPRHGGLTLLDVGDPARSTK
jgi:hypothetical protein